jgi:hypothetical protein
MKTLIALTVAAIALAACDNSMPYSHAAQKCRDLRLTVGSPEYNDCVDKLHAEEGAIAGSKNLH